MEDKVIELLMLSDKHMTAADVAKKLGKKRAKDVINVLESLKKKKVLHKVKVGGRVHWSIEDESDGVNQNDVIAEMNTDIPVDRYVSSVEGGAGALYSMIENLKREIEHLREEASIKNQHIDALLDILAATKCNTEHEEKSVSPSTANSVQQVIVNDAPDDTLKINSGNNKVVECNLLDQVSSDKIVNDNSSFISPRRTRKAVDNKLRDGIPLYNRFGTWLNDLDVNDDLDDDLNSEYSEGSASKDKTGCLNTQGKRPQVVVNEYPESESKFPCTKHQFRNKSRKPVVAICGDSILKYCTAYDIRHHCKEATCYVKPFLGSDIDDMYDYLKPILRKNHIDCLVLHISTNDASSENYISTDSICDKLKQLIEWISSLGIIVVLSLPVIRTDNFSNVITELIPKLIALCNSLLVNYVDNRNLYSCHLNNSGLHLNKSGTAQLNENIGIFLDFLIPKFFINSN